MRRKLPGKCDSVCDRQGEEVEQKLTRVTELKIRMKTRTSKYIFYFFVQKISDLVK